LSFCTRGSPLSGAAAEANKPSWVVGFVTGGLYGGHRMQTGGRAQSSNPGRTKECVGEAQQPRRLKRLSLTRDLRQPCHARRRPSILDADADYESFPTKGSN